MCAQMPAMTNINETPAKEYVCCNNQMPRGLRIQTVLVCPSYRHARINLDQERCTFFLLSSNIYAFLHHADQLFALYPVPCVALH